MSVLQGTVRTARPATRFTTTVVAVSAATGLASVVAFMIRTAQAHVGLLYPDGYQYLLMARGLAEHLSPTTRLGPAGDLFVPSLDAAVKPLFPALIAAADRLGADPLVAARTITTLAAAAVVVLAGLLVLRLTGSAAGAIVAGAACLLSPTLTFWSGFMGADPLAQALALGSGLACASRRPVVAGSLAGLAIATRPEFAVIGIAATLAALCSGRLRHDAIRAAASGALSLTAAYLVVHPTLALPAPALVVAGLLATCLAATGMVAAYREPRVGVAATAVTAVFLASGAAGHTVVRADALVLGLAVAGVLLLALTGGDRLMTAFVTTSAVSLVVVYTLKNPNADRYLAVLVPMAAVVAGAAVAHLGKMPGRRTLAVPVVATLLVAALLVATTVAPTRPDVGPDAFATLAPQLTDEPALPLVTAAPDAFGWLLPERSVRALRPGARGLILLDGAQRLYAPDLDARGSEVARFDQASFLRPNGSVDTGQMFLVTGVVTRRSH
ncbi:MAG: hypothetical protein EXQ81_03175 [Thermoleophilia bacterium]|nr:hypothetical protein [Thermoleophilia bacterium]